MQIPWIGDVGDGNSPLDARGVAAISNDMLRRTHGGRENPPVDGYSDHDCGEDGGESSGQAGDAHHRWPPTPGWLGRLVPLRLARRFWHRALAQLRLERCPAVVRWGNVSRQLAQPPDPGVDRVAHG